MKSPSSQEEKPRHHRFSRPLRRQLWHRRVNRRRRRRPPSPLRFPPKPVVSPANAASISPTSAARVPAEKFSLPTFSPLRSPNPRHLPPQLPAPAPHPYNRRR